MVFSRWSVLFLVTFIALVIYFLLSYFLAAIHDQYNHVLKVRPLP